MEYEAPLNHTSEQCPLISPAKRREISGRAPSYFEEIERKCAEATAQLTPSDWDEADRARCAQIKPRAQTEETHRADRSKSPPPPWIHTGSACRSLPDKLWKLKKRKLSHHGNTQRLRSEPWIYSVLMETMSPQQGTMGQNRSDSLTRESKALPADNKKVPAGHNAVLWGVVLMMEGARFAHLVLLDMISWRY